MPDVPENSGQDCVRRRVSMICKTSAQAGNAEELAGRRLRFGNAIGVEKNPITDVEQH